MSRVSNSSSASNAAPAEPPNLISLRKFLDDYHAVVTCVFFEEKHGPVDMKYQINLYHTSRLFSAGLKLSVGGHGPDPDVLARQILDKVKAAHQKELELQVDHVAQLKKYMDENFNDGIYLFSEDRHEQASRPGRRFKVWVELDKNSDEFKRCGLIKKWIFAEGYGCNDQQAAHNALEMLSLKQRKNLLWINEADGEVNYFREKDLRKLKKNMQVKDVPNCHKSDPPVEADPPASLPRSGSTLSMKSFFRLSPFGTPTTERKSFIGQEDLAGSSRNIATPRNTSPLSGSGKPSSDNLRQTSESAGKVGKSERRGPIPEKGSPKAKTPAKTPVITNENKDKGGEGKTRQGSGRDDHTSSRATQRTRAHVG